MSETNTNSLRIEVRCGDEWTTAAVQLPGVSDPFVLATVQSNALMASTDVQEAFNSLAVAVMQAALSDALPGTTIKSVRVVEPGAPLDSKSH